MCHLAPCRDTDDAEATAALFRDNCFRFHGWPSKGISDRGPDFTNKFTAAMNVEANLHLAGRQDYHDNAKQPTASQHQH